MAVTNLNEKIVFITGAAAGIGHATARAFAEAGSTVIASDRKLGALEETRRAVEDTGRPCHTIELDVSDEAAFTEVAAQVDEEIGTPHVVVNNAGVGIHGSFLNVPTESIRRLMDVNLYGVMHGCRAFLPQMLAANDPRHLVNVASLASIAPVPNMSAYAASKYAVDGLTEVLAMELEETPIGVTCVHPGVINTAIVDGDSYNGAHGQLCRQRMGEYYQKNGSDPSVVALGIVDAVRQGKAHLYVGASAPSTSIFKRLSPTLTRRFAMKSARKAGFV